MFHFLYAKTFFLGPPCAILCVEGILLGPVRMAFTKISHLVRVLTLYISGAWCFIALAGGAENIPRQT